MFERPSQVAKGHLKHQCNGSEHSLVYLHLWKSAGFQLFQNLQSFLEQILLKVCWATQPVISLPSTSSIDIWQNRGDFERPRS